MEALEALKQELDDPEIDFSSELSVIYGLFRGLTWPEVSIPIFFLDILNPRIKIFRYN